MRSRVDVVGEDKLRIEPGTLSLVRVRCHYVTQPSKRRYPQLRQTSSISEVTSTVAKERMVEELRGSPTESLEVQRPPE